VERDGGCRGAAADRQQGPRRDRRSLPGPLRRRRPEVRVSTVHVPGGGNNTQAAPMNEDDLIDVTDLGLL